MKVITLPTLYSEADGEERNRHLEAIAALNREYRERAEPHIKALTDIEARYAPRQVILDGRPQE